jgi:hypothetical protein
MQRTHLPDLVQRARQLFEASKASGRFPLIDCSDLDVGDYCLDLSWSFYDPGVLETARSECETLLAQDPNDLPCRFVVLRIFFTLTYWRFPEKESEVSAFRSASRQHFAELVRLRDVSACVDKRDIEWEIVNACAVFDWERASQLHDLLRRYSESQEETILCYLEKGRLLFLSVILGQDSFEDDGEIEEPMLSLWCPQMKVLDPVTEMIVTAHTIGGRSPSVSIVEKDRLRDAVAQVQKAQDRAENVHALYLAILARCLYMLGHYGDSAHWLNAAYAQGAYKILCSNALNEKRVEQLILGRSAIAYIRAGKFAEADSIKKKLFGLGPLTSQEYRGIAEEEAKQARFLEAWEALNEMKDWPDSGGDWLVSTLFAIGDLSNLSLEQAVTKLETLDHKLDPGGRLDGVVEGMLRAFFIPFARLDESVRGLLIRGFKNLYAGGDFEGHHREGFFNCAIALEICLKVRIFQRYEESTGQVGWFKKLGGEPLTLGVMVRLIESAMHEEPALHEFKRCLTNWAPRLPEAIKEVNVSGRDGIVGHANRHRHEPGPRREIDCATARRLSNDCLRVLSSLYSGKL